MRLGARIQTVIDLLNEVTKDSNPYDKTVTAFFRDKRYIGSKDRRYISSSIWGIIRNQAKIDYIISSCKLTKSSRLRAITYFAKFDDTITDEELISAFSGEQYCPTEMSEAEINLKITASSDISFPEHVLYECPEWLFNKIKNQYSDYDLLLNALNQEAELCFRINPHLINIEEAQKKLKDEDIQTNIGKYSPLCLSSEKRANLNACKAYKEGLIEVQDEGSQLIAILADCKKEHTIMDYCAGGGGKSIAIASIIGTDGEIVASDNNLPRLNKITPRANRNHLNNIVTLMANKSWRQSHGLLFDRVLLDVPCTGTGTWRRSPDARLKNDEGFFEKTVIKQQHILEEAYQLVKPGGRLIYSTCSILEEENQKQIEVFLRKYPEFKLVNMKSLWKEVINTPYPCEDERYMAMLPHLHQSDGFFMAVMERM